ncbi:DUF4442 domain-containing protein [Stenotrophomonas sp. NLF4-10]|uniref:DUF4442 domain-containing protein n=1 Tax=Stenotrophomonas sp. NLF4-10 TaxID=2918754 RepID=UPI001EFB24ED|nr:DUF4442 domain-containing protein [Stenotrophomonas sp. NLF4-10]MCG8276441.1 DUF4442 domain-containing protein [Stenotrophomonas sp. NLF4-10]
MKASTFRHGINLWPPFLMAGIHVTAIRPDYRHVRVELRQRPWNMNYVGTHFGGSLFAMTDPFWMLCLLHNLGRDYYVWDKAGDIEFVKPGKGVVATEFRLDDALLDEVRAATASGEKYLRWFENDILDAQGEVVARVRKQVYVRLKPEARANPKQEP